MTNSQDSESLLTHYVEIDKSGVILLSGTVPEFMFGSQTAAPGNSIVKGKGHWDTDYVLDGVITQRPANPSTISGMKISNVPNPSTVTIDGVNPTTVTDGEVDLAFTLPGTYKVVVSSWPALDAVFEVTQP